VPASASAAGVERSRFVEAIAAIHRALEERRFDDLDAMHAEWLAGPVRTRDGTWLLEAFEWAFDAKFSSDSPARLQALFEDWGAKAPASRLRAVAHSHMWQRRALKLRADRCATRQVPTDPKVYAILLERAATALAAEGAMAHSPLAYSTALRIAGARGEAPERLEAILAEGTARFPAYRPMYWARMSFLLPEWGGSERALDEFARSAAERSRDLEGRSFYALLYADVLREACQGVTIVDSAATWPELKESFEDLVARHDDAQNWNLFGTLACRFRDVETTARVLARMGAQANLGVWSSGASTESCRAMIRPARKPNRIASRPRAQPPVLAQR
jgi:hypothetical protein